ncbi:MAG: hypothetical protein ACYSW0_21755 [Planctomycetota bacterium]
MSERCYNVPVTLPQAVVLVVACYSRNVLALAGTSVTLCLATLPSLMLVQGPKP